MPLQICYYIIPNDWTSMLSFPYSIILESSKTYSVFPFTPINKV